ncbi:cell envelope biogenesis protein TolA [Sphingobium terrigena]|uniref:Cell envelope biogenesis protein TolA n=1 Tax=Sphingobium terrigena TaxID=2304063 RepID=A0A418YYN4_9SPHN|nr:cell envelope biogenesis protein TolA [Sphingobium terrigena]RJG57970.1 cell envelope biogenesis protein TolA [Sphingobium terrigena]
MERTEKIGLGVATAGHVLLFGLLSAGFLATPNPLKLKTPPMEVSMVDEVALQSTAPKLSAEPPPPSVAPEQGPTEDAAPAPEPEPAPEPVPVPPKPQPKPAPPKPVAKPAPEKPKPTPPKKDVAKVAPKPKPAPEKPAPKAKPAPDKPKAAAAPAKPAAKASAKPATKTPARASGQGKADKPKGSLLGNDFLKGIDTNADAPRKPPTPAPAAAMGPAQKSALDAELRRQLKPHWRPPSGADADQLVTLLEVRLDKSGAVIGTPEIIDQLGVTASNRPQAKLHAERAIQAVKLASPFRNMPPEFYDQWKWLRPLRFDARLNR